MGEGGEERQAAQAFACAKALRQKGRACWKDSKPGKEKTLENLEGPSPPSKTQ